MDKGGVVLKNIFKKEKLEVYLGILAVVPRAGIEKIFDSWGTTERVDLEDALREQLVEIFCLPSLDSIQNPEGNEFAIDVLIPQFQLGTALFDDAPMVIFWRPKITLVSKLYHLKTGKIRKIVSVTEKMPWREFFGRILSFQALIQLKPVFNNQDLEKLLFIASGKVMAKITKSA